MSISGTPFCLINTKSTIPLPVLAVIPLTIGDILLGISGSSGTLKRVSAVGGMCEGLPEYITASSAPVMFLLGLRLLFFVLAAHALSVARSLSKDGTDNALGERSSNS